MAAAEPSAEEEEEEEEEGGLQPRGASEYEEQRLVRIKENRARLEALGLPALSSSLLRAPSKRRRHGEEQEENKSQSDAKKKRRAVCEEDEEYQPSDDGDEEEVDGDGSSSGEQDEEEEDYKPPSSSSSRRTPKIKQGKKKDSLNGAKVRRSLYLKAKMKEPDSTDDDIALKQAIALSLGGNAEDFAPVSVGSFRDSGANVADEGGNIKINRGNIQNSYAKKKRKGNVSRVQLTEDEVVAYFFTFDEVGKGEITLRDLRRMAAAHDFCWTDIEMASMIHCFDSNRDGKLSLDDFRNIVTRCNMMQKS